MKEPKEAIQDNGTMFLSDSDIESIIISACTVCPHTEDDLNKLFKWADGVRMDQALLGLVLDGTMLVQWSGNEPTFTKRPN